MGMLISKIIKKHSTTKASKRSSSCDKVSSGFFDNKNIVDFSDTKSSTDKQAKDSKAQTKEDVSTFVDGGVKGVMSYLSGEKFAKRSPTAKDAAKSFIGGGLSSVFSSHATSPRPSNYKEEEEEEEKVQQPR